MQDHDPQKHPVGPAPRTDTLAPAVVGSHSSSSLFLGTPVFSNSNSLTLGIRTATQGPLEAPLRGVYTPPVVSDAHHQRDAYLGHPPTRQGTPLPLDVGSGPRPPTPLYSTMPPVPKGPTLASSLLARVNHSNPAVPARTQVERTGPPRPPPLRPRGNLPRLSPNPHLPPAPRWASGRTARDHPSTRAGPSPVPRPYQGPNSHYAPTPRGTPPRPRAVPILSDPHPTQPPGSSDNTYPSPTPGNKRRRDTPSQTPADTTNQAVTQPSAHLRDPRRHPAQEPTLTTPSHPPSSPRDTGRQRSRKQPHPKHVSPTTVRRTNRARAQHRLLPPGTHTRGGGPAPPSRGPPRQPHPAPTATTAPPPPDAGPSTPPGRRPPASASLPVPTVPTPPLPNTRYLARACKVREKAAPPPRQYAHTRTRGGGIRLGLGPSDIPHAGWGVFALSPIKVGAIVLDYSGPLRSREWVENPLNDARYVWGDENEIDALAAQGRLPIYIDANPAVSTSWGGRVNDGFHRGAHLRAERVRGSDRVILRAIAPAAEDEELYLEYGGDYWQGHYHTLPPSVQDEARAHYDLTVIDGRCYTPAQRRQAANEGRIHYVNKHWHDGPPPQATRKRTPQAPPPPRLPRAPPQPDPTRDLEPDGDLLPRAPLPRTTSDRTPPPARPFR